MFGGAIYNGIPTGVKYFAYMIDPEPPEGKSPAWRFIEAIQNLATTSPTGNPLDAILSIFIAPYWLIKDGLTSEVYESITPKIKHTGISNFS